jgi:hypothetical protein
MLLMFFSHSPIKRTQKINLHARVKRADATLAVDVAAGLDMAVVIISARSHASLPQAKKGKRKKGMPPAERGIFGFFVHCHAKSQVGSCLAAYGILNLDDLTK